MNLYEAQAVRLAFGLSKAQCSNIAGVTQALIVSYESGQLPVSDRYRDFWVRMCEMREEYKALNVDYMPKAKFRGTAMQWAARESARGSIVSRFLASKSKVYNPMFSQLNQPSGL